MRRHAASGRKGFVDHFGVAVRADEILFRHRRFAPTSVGRSAHARALWSLKTVPCCTESWEYLLDSCPCGAVQGWRYAERLDRCDICNIDLGALPGTPVPAEIRDDLSFLVGLLDPHPVRRSEARRRLPPGLTEWDAGMVFELALALMPLTRSGHRPMRGMKPDFEQLPQYTASLAEAARLVLDWPSSFVPALEAAVHSHGRSRPNVRYPGIGHYVAGMDGGITPAPVTAAIKEVLKPISDGAKHAIDMRQAMRLTGQQRGLMLTAMLGGLVSSTAVTVDLEKAGAIERQEQSAPSGRGRPRVLFERAAGFAYAVSVQISSDALHYALSDYRGKLIDRFSTVRDVNVAKAGPLLQDVAASVLRPCRSRGGHEDYTRAAQSPSQPRRVWSKKHRVLPSGQSSSLVSRILST